MGFFSWETSDTDESIWSHYSDAAMADNQKPNENNPVYIVTPDSKEYKVIRYDGYGNFIFEMDKQLHFNYRNTYMWYAVQNTEMPRLIQLPVKKDGFDYYVVNAFILIYAQNYSENLESMATKTKTFMAEFGQELDMKRNKDKYPDLRFLKFASKPGLNYFDLKAAEHCPNQGYFYGGGYA